MDNLSSGAAFTLLQAQQASQPSALQSLDAIKNEAKSARQAEAIEAAAQDFEAVFLSEMMKPMFEGLETGGEFGGGQAEEVFRGFMIQEYGKILAETGTIGIADQVKAELIKRQGLETQDEKPKDITQYQSRESAEEKAFDNLISGLATVN